MIQALADVTGRCRAKRKQNTHGRSAGVHMVGPTQRSPNVWQARERMIPRENTNLRWEVHDNDEDAKVVCGRTDAGPNVQENCRICGVIQAVSGMASVQEEQQLRLNAALLSMVQGAVDATNSAGVAESRILEPWRHCHKLDFRRRALNHTTQRRRTIAGRIHNWLARGWGRSVVFELPLVCGRSGCRVVCVSGTRIGSPNESPCYPRGGGG